MIYHVIFDMTYTVLVCLSFDQYPFLTRTISLYSIQWRFAESFRVSLMIDSRFQTIWGNGLVVLDVQSADWFIIEVNQ